MANELVEAVQPVVVLATEEDGSAWALELSRRGHSVTLCPTPQDALLVSRLMGGCPVLVGSRFTTRSVVEAARALRSADPALPVLALAVSVGGAETQRLVDGGADDVLGHDDDPERVSGRLRSLARIRRRDSGGERLGGLTLDPRSRTVRGGDSAVELRPREFGVLLHLVHAGGQVVPFDELQDVQWSGHDDGDSAMRSCMYRLRKALTDLPDLNVEIETVRNRGYRLRTLQPA